MSDSQTHLVGRQTIELHLDQKEGAFDIQDKVRKLLVSDINPVLDEACSGLVSPDEVIQIDKLEIELGLVNVDQIERDFAPLVGRHLRANLADRVGLLRHENALAARIKKTDRAIRGSPPDESGRFADCKISEIDYQLQLLQFFLQTGNLPWHQQTLTPFSPENIFSVLLQKTPEKSKALLEGELRHPVSRQRLIYQFSDELLVEVTGLLAPESKNEVHSWITDLAAIGKIVPGVDITIPKNRFSFWDTLISGLQASAGGTLSGQQLATLLLASTGFHESDSGKALLGRPQEAVDRLSRSGIQPASRLPEIITQQIEKLKFCGQQERFKGSPVEPGTDDSKHLALLDQKIPERLSIPSKQEVPPDGPDYRGPGDHPAARPLAPETGRMVSPPAALLVKAGDLTADEKIPDRLQPDDAPPLREIYVNNAGLVLLWPYFNNLFKQFNLIDETGFTDDAARARAVHLLQYLATGKQQTGEFELPLNKLLCGWDLLAPLDKFIQLTDAERTECRKLLTAAIAHWQALKKTSVETFLDSFLTRNGVLQKKDLGWHLTIERRAYDLLLERLPWGISVIKLSWMPAILTVEWH